MRESAGHRHHHPTTGDDGAGKRLPARRLGRHLLLYNQGNKIYSQSNASLSYSLQAALALLAGAFRRAGLGGIPLAAIFNRVWTHSGGQLSLLRAAAAAPPEVLSFSGSRKQAPFEGLANGASATGTPNEAWLSLDFLETLARLSGGRFCFLCCL